MVGLTLFNSGEESRAPESLDRDHTARWSATRSRHRWGQTFPPPSCFSSSCMHFLLQNGLSRRDSRQPHHRHRFSPSCSRVTLPGQAGEGNSHDHWRYLLCTLLCPSPSYSNLSPIWPPLSRLGLVQEADPHGNGTSGCFPSSAFLTPQGLSDYSKGYHRILRHNYF